MTQNELEIVRSGTANALAMLAVLQAELNENAVIPHLLQDRLESINSVLTKMYSLVKPK